MSRRNSPRILARLGSVAVLAVAPLLFAAIAVAGTYYSQGSLDATALASWNAAREGGGPAPADFLSGDVFVVQAAHTMTLSGPWTISGAGAALQIEAGGTLVVPAGQALALACPVSNAGALEVQGTLRFDEGGAYDAGSAAAPVYSSGAALVYANSSAVNVGGEWTGTGGAGPGVPAGVSIVGAGSVTLPATDRGIPGPLAVASGALVLNPASGDLEVGGDWTLAAGAAFAPNGRVVRFNGAADQNVTSGGEAFAGVTIAKPSGTVTLADDLAVDGTLTLSSGNVETGPHVVSIGAGGSVSRTSGHVAGQLRKTLAAGASTNTFEVGDPSTYAPVVVAGHGAGFSSAFDLTVSSPAGDPAALASSGIAPDRSVNRTYVLTAAGYTGGPFSVTCAFAPADLDAGAAPARFVIRRHDGGAWSATTTGTRTATSTRATGMNAFGELAVGEQAIDHYDVAASSPQPAGAVFTTTVTARDLLNEIVVDDSTTSVTMTSSGAAEFDADGNATFGDASKTLAAGTFGIATRDGTGETITLTATDANARTGSLAGLVIQAPLAVATTSLPDGIAGSAYSQALAATGGTPPYSGWTVTAGTLPAGLTLDGGTGVLGGTPVAVETQAFTVRVGDAAGDTATQALSIAIGPGAPASLAFVQQPTPALVGAILAPPVTVRVTDAFANGVPGETVTLSLVGSGTLGGYAPVTTDTAGLATFATLTVGEAGPGKRLEASSGALGPVASEPFDITCTAISVVPESVPEAWATVPYTHAFGASAGVPPFSFALIAGALPAGLTLSPAGALSGTPTESGPFTFTVGVTDAQQCTGSREYTLVVLAAPAAITDLAAQTVTSGNDADGTAKLTVTFTTPPGAATVEVYRAGFGGYPRYDNAGGSVPAIPSYPPGPPWALTAVAASGQADEPATRDFWYYVAFSKNAGGATSPVSNRTPGALGYHLGDVSDGLTLGQGNNLVGSEDVSLLGANYGVAEPELTVRGVHYLDVGPTTDLLLSSRPFTDGRVDFEDFIVFATNFLAVSAPPLAAVPAAGESGDPDALRLDAPATVVAGEAFTASLRFAGSGRVQGFSAALAWDAAVVEPLAVTSSGWLEGQGGLVLSPRQAAVDAALLGVRGRGISGEGEVATVAFRALRAGAPRIAFARVIARDPGNHPVALDTASTATGEPPARRTALAPPWPNPAPGSATLEFSLESAARIELAIYSVDGRRVKTLASGGREAGAWRLTWDGSDESGRPVAPGLYYARLQAGERRFTHRLVLLR